MKTGVFIKYFVRACSVKMSNPLKDLELSTKDLKAIAKIRGIKGYKSMSEDKLLRAFTLSKPVKKVRN